MFSFYSTTSQVEVLLLLSRGEALNEITYTLLKKSRKKIKSRKNQKSKKSRTPFFQVLYPSIAILNPFSVESERVEIGIIHILFMHVFILLTQEFFFIEPSPNL